MYDESGIPAVVEILLGSFVAERDYEALAAEFAEAQSQHRRDIAEYAVGNVALRGALERIAINAYGPPCGCVDIAREALRGEGEK
jgi:hypothetical protein